MFKLFEDKIDELSFVDSCFIDGNKATYEILLSSGKNILEINWKKCKYDEVVLSIDGSGLLTILEIGEPNNIKVVLLLGDYARVNHSIASLGGDSKNNYEVVLNEYSEYRGALADFSIGKKDFNFECYLNGVYSKANWNLASLSTDNDYKTFYVSFYHHAKHTYAKMENYGVCEDDSTLNFFGTSSIERGAKTSATHQSAKIMVFDEKCRAKASPILCIDENDVEASHAAVVGQINESHIFYLTSRGIPEDEAKKLITLGYLNPILNFFEDDKILKDIQEAIERRF